MFYHKDRAEANLWIGIIIFAAIILYLIAEKLFF